MHSWFLLIAAIVAEVGGTTCLKLSYGFSRLVPSLGVVVLYSLAFVLLAAVLLIETISPFDSDVVIIPSKTLTILNDFFYYPADL